MSAFNSLIVVSLVSTLISVGRLSLDVEAKKPDNCVQANGTIEGGIVCVCGSVETSCDWFNYQHPDGSGEAKLIESTRLGERFNVRELVRFAIDEQDVDHTNFGELDSITEIKVDLSARYQKILGWGGAFTDAAGTSISSLPEGARMALLKSYFDVEGLQYNMGRIPIGGCDFSLRNYTYDDLPNDHEDFDYDLTHWSLTHEDHQLKLPWIREANKIRAKFAHDKSALKLFGSPWSPPAWMKDNKNLTRGHLIDDDRIYKAYAEYLVKFYKAYEQELGFEIWGGTVQNEPGSAFFPGYFFNSLQLGSHQAAKFISEYLGPALERNGFTKDRFKLMVGDDTLGNINYQVPTIMENQLVQKYVSGLAFHWYASGWQEPYDKLDECMERIGDKVDFVLMTEACNGWRKWLEPALDLGSWQRGEAYAVDIFQDILRNSAGWIDWNLALDTNGGPNWVNNTVDSPIIVDKSKGVFYKQPMFYVLGHFSRFFKHDSTRVKTAPSTRDYKDPFMVAAVHNTHERIVAINLLNRQDTERRVSVKIKHNRLVYSSDTIVLSPNSISTINVRL